MKQLKCLNCKAPLLRHESICPNCNTKVKAQKRKGHRCTCKDCGTKFRAEGATPGSLVDCPKCGAEVKVPRPESIAVATTLASMESRPRKKLGAGWDTTYDGLDRLYFYGCISGFTLLAWTTCLVVGAMFVFIPMLVRAPWAPYVLLIGLSGLIIRHALEDDEDMRLWGAYIGLGWLVAIPLLGLFLTLAIFSEDSASSSSP